MSRANHFPLAISLLLSFGFAAIAQNPLGRAFQLWVDEDVVYLIAPAERTAFLRLAADEERTKFIEQFWLRRDPTPNTPDNEAREIHYQRIAAANERYAFAGNPGWKTDRGMIFIKYGAPDELERRPGSERWRYRSIEGIGNDVVIEFTDPGTGDYRMTGDPTAR
jgi:GWxTD domain-containing protein